MGIGDFPLALGPESLPPGPRTRGVQIRNMLPPNPFVKTLPRSRNSVLFAQAPSSHLSMRLSPGDSGGTYNSSVLESLAYRCFWAPSYGKVLKGEGRCPSLPRSGTLSKGKKATRVGTEGARGFGPMSDYAVQYIHKAFELETGLHAGSA